MSFEGWSCKQAWELKLCLDNDRQAYDHVQGINAMIKRRKYNKTQAIAAFIRAIDNVLPMLKRKKIYPYSRTTATIKKEVAEEMWKEYKDEYLKYN